MINELIKNLMFIGSFVNAYVITIDISNIYLLIIVFLSGKIKLKIKRTGVLEYDIVSPLWVQPIGEAPC